MTKSESLRGNGYSGIEIQISHAASEHDKVFDGGISLKSNTEGPTVHVESISQQRRQRERYDAGKVAAF